MTFLLEPFQPFPLFSLPHTQTILGAVLRSETGIAFRRERISTPDGDFLDLDFPAGGGVPGPGGRPPSGDDRPLVLVLHGLDSSARSAYNHEMYRALAAAGLRAVGLNFRGCSGEPPRTASLYHGGQTADLAAALDWLNLRFPETPLGVVGFSLGGNTLLKYLGEESEAARGRLAAAAVISPPFDLAAGARRLDRGGSRLYERRFVRSLQAQLLAHTALHAKIDLAAVRQARTLEDLTAAALCPLLGYATPAAYYADASCGPRLGGVRVPTLLLRAGDDPFYPAEEIPFREIAANPAFMAGFPPRGGHLGFWHGSLARPRFWAERQAARFLAHILLREGNPGPVISPR